MFSFHVVLDVKDQSKCVVAETLSFSSNRNLNPALTSASTPADMPNANVADDVYDVPIS